MYMIIYSCMYILVYIPCLCVLCSPRLVLKPPKTWGRQRALQEHQVLCRDAGAQQLGLDQACCELLGKSYRKENPQNGIDNDHLGGLGDSGLGHPKMLGDDMR